MRYARLSLAQSQNSHRNSDMWTGDKPPSDISHKKSVFGFLAGLGIGIVIGLLRAIFHTNPKQPEQPRGQSKKPHSKSEPVLTEMVSERNDYRATGEEGTGSNIEADLS